MFEFDLADRVDDLICIFDNGNQDSDMDTISILLTGWITFLFCSVLLVKFIYRKYKYKAHPEQEQEVKIEEIVEKLRIPVVNGTTEKIQLSVKDDPVKNELKKVKVNEVPKKSQEDSPRKEHLLRCSGPDPIVVDFVTASYNWLYIDEEGRKKISETVNSLFLNSVNKIFHGIPQEDTFVSTVDNLSLSNDLSLQNLFAEYEDFNTIKVTCDCEAKFTGHLSLSSDFFGQEEKIYEFIVNRLIGRLKFLFHIEKKVVNFKFDGWPEICLAVGNTSKKNIRLDPKFSEIITSRLSSAIRNATMEIYLDKLQNFPTLPTTQTKMKSKNKNSFFQIHLKQGVGIGLGLYKESELGQAYCVIELDDPAQKFHSNAQKLPHPVWNETYVINAGTNCDCELLFEVYSSIGTIFLGCHIVSVDQIVEGKKELLHLKSRRMKVSESITGTLEVMFTLVDEIEGARHITQQNSRNPVYKEKLTLPTISDGESKVQNSTSKNWTEPPGNPPIPPTRQPKKSNTTTKLEDQYGDERGRRRTRRGEIFTSLRRRFSKERSKSVAVNDGPESIDLHSNSDFARSVSVDRPGARVLELGSDSTRSSASELSQYSAHSTTTFIHESSTLLLEVIEHDMKKYYLVPHEEVGTGKWKNKKKLHIFNDHTFVAKRIQSGLSCTVCFGRFPFSLRKQGYQCRDCRLISHKECHIRIPTFCLKSTIYDIDVITV